MSEAAEVGIWEILISIELIFTNETECHCDENNAV